MNTIENTAREAVMAYLRWMEADGIFPEPEYDRFQDAMSKLAEALGIDTIAESELLRGLNLQL